MRLYNEAVASYKKKSAETFSSLTDYFKDCSEYKDLGEKSKRAYDGYLKLVESRVWLDANRRSRRQAFARRLQRVS